MTKGGSPGGNKYINLGFQLRRIRSAEDSDLVQEILKKDISVEEKTLEIEKVDRRARELRIKERFEACMNSINDPRIRSNVQRIRKGTSAYFRKSEKKYLSISILLIDDLTYITKTVSYTLEKNGFSVSTARNGIEGIILYRRILPHLIITDLRLPDLNGFEVASFIRKVDEALPIIFITAVDDFDRRYYEGIKGKKAYLQKPIKSEILLETIDDLLLEE